MGKWRRVPYFSAMADQRVTSAWRHGVNPEVLGATFAIFGAQDGGTPLWSEDQNVALDANGSWGNLNGTAVNYGVTRAGGGVERIERPPNSDR